MRKKNAFEYIFLALFIMCAGFALCAALEYNTLAIERPYLQQGIWLLALAALTLLAYLGVRIMHKAGNSLSRYTKGIAYWTSCIFFFAIGLFARIWVIENIPITPASDFETYYRIGEHLLNDTMLTPQAEVYRQYVVLYPHVMGFPLLVLQPAFALFGVSVKTALYANLVCSMLAVALAGHIGKRIAGKIGSLAAIALMSLWPSHIFYSSMVASEQSFTLLLMVALDLMINVIERRKGSMYDIAPNQALISTVLLGVVFGLAGAIRPMAMVLLAAYLVMQLMTKGDAAGKIKEIGVRAALAKGWLCVAIVLICYFCTSSIFTKIIADTTLEEPVGGIDACGYNLMVGVNAGQKGLWNQEDADFFMNTYRQTGSASQAHQACMQMAIYRIQNQPEDVLNLLIYKFRDLWQTDDFGIDWVLWSENTQALPAGIKGVLETVRPVGRLMYMAVLLYGLYSSVLVWRRRTASHSLHMVMVLFFLGTALLHMLLETQVRYHYNMIPCLILLVSFTVAEWREMIAAEPVVQLIDRKEVAAEKVMEDHTNFDMHTALREGHVHMSVSEAVAERSAQYSLVSVAMADDAEDEVTANEEESAESAVLDTEENAEAVTEEAPVEESVEETTDDAEAIAEEVAEEAAESADTEVTVEGIAEEATAEVEENCDAVEEGEVSSEDADPEEETEVALESAAETTTEETVEEVAEADAVAAAAEDDTAPEDVEDVPAEITSEADDVIDEVAVMMAEESCEAAAEEPMEESEEAAVEAVAADVETDALAEEETEEAPAEPEAAAEEAPAVAEPNEEQEPEVQLEEAMAEPELAAVNAPATDLSADVDVLPMVYVKPVKKQASAVQGKIRAAAKPVAKKTTASTALKTPRAPAKRQKLSQQDRVQRTVERRKAVARRKQRRQRQAARR